MFDLRVTNPTQTDADADFVFGKARNIVTQGDNTGTPWNAFIINNTIFGPLSAMLDAADITPNGTEEKAGQSQVIDALRQLVQDYAWGDRFVGKFEDGFTYTAEGQVGRSGGNYYVYAGSDPLPKVVTAGTDPSSPDYTQVLHDGVNSVRGLLSELNARTYNFESVSDMKSNTNISNYHNKIVRVIGYYAGGHVLNIDTSCHYLIKTLAESVSDGDVIDEYGNHTLQDGYVAILQYESEKGVLQFGAKGDGITLDTSPIQAALDAIYAFKIKIPRGDYLVGTLEVKLKKWVEGEGVDITTLKQTSGAQLILTGNDSPAYKSYQRLNGLTIDGQDRTGGGLLVSENAEYEVSLVKVRRCSTGVYNYGSLIGSYYKVVMENNNTGLVLANDKDGTDLDAPSNLVSFRNCALIANKYGCTYADTSPTNRFGSQILFEMVDVEANGQDENGVKNTTPTFFFSADSANSIEPAVTFRNCWFETNFGDTEIAFNNNHTTAVSLVVENTLFIGTKQYSIDFLNNAGGNCRLTIDKCGFTSPAAQANIRVRGSNVNGGIYRSTYESVDIASSLEDIFYVENSNGQVVSNEVIAQGKKLKLLGLGATVAAELYGEGNNDVRFKSGRAINLETVDGTKPVNVVNNLIQCGTNYLWFDSSGNLRKNTGFPADKDTSGTVIG